MSLRLSVLDQAPISEGSTASEALRNSVDLARRADALGYHRYWVAEHHGTPALACTSPEALIGPIAAATARLRVGSGGVMLPHYSPFKVAETFTLLSGLFPGRIDLGLGRASGTDPRTALALQRDRAAPGADDFPDQLVELLAYLSNGIPARHAFARQGEMLAPLQKPEPWLLGSSGQSALWAAELGLPYAFADFINGAGAELAGLYRERFAPSRWLAVPRTTVAAWVLCAETDAEARRLAQSGRMLFQLFRSGRLVPVPSVETAERFFADQGGMPLHGGRRTIVGSPRTVREGVEALAAEYVAEEVMVVTLAFDHAARVRSYALIAEAFGLTGS
ncbi:MAG: LLM class flavin-dependent oxidoreductase [Myxococcales bacterium]